MCSVFASSVASPHIPYRHHIVASIITAMADPSNPSIADRRSSASPPLPNPVPPPPASFRSSSFLLSHISSILDFYLPRCRDPSGGFYHCYRDDGSVYEPALRHVVSSTRFVVLFLWAHQLFPQDARFLPLAQHGLQFLRQRHRRANGGYRWEFRLGEEAGQQPEPNYSYAMAFVLLTFATAVQCGLEECRQEMEETTSVWDQFMWEPQPGLYADEASQDWKTVVPYRGQNCVRQQRQPALRGRPQTQPSSLQHLTLLSFLPLPFSLCQNMHAVEAHLAAYTATGSSRYLQRAQLIASNLAHRLTPIVQRDTGLPLLYEHYNTDWTAVDLRYNVDKPSDVFRPWGFQPGHLVEWARLLLQLHALRGPDGAEAEGWYVERARQLFDAAMQFGWDDAVGGGGVVYCFSPIAPHAICDADKYKWVNIESAATAARLALITGDERYWLWYDRLWAWCWTHLIDHRHGAWYRLTDRDGRRYDDLKSPPGKVDYHVVGACKDVISVMQQ